MSEQNIDTSVGAVLTWDIMLEIAQAAAEREAADQKECVIMCGMVAWSGVRKIVQDRMRQGPPIADVFVIDTIEWRPSMCVPPAQILCLHREQIEMTVPLLLKAVPGIDME